MLSDNQAESLEEVAEAFAGLNAVGLEVQPIIVNGLRSDGAVVLTFPEVEAIAARINELAEIVRQNALVAED
jgi:hypothetical protein